MTEEYSIGRIAAIGVPLTLLTIAGAYGQTQTDQDSTYCKTPEERAIWLKNDRKKNIDPLKRRIENLETENDSLLNIQERIQYLPRSGGDINISFGDIYFTHPSELPQKEIPKTNYTRMPIFNVGAGVSTTGEIFGEASFGVHARKDIFLGAYFNAMFGKKNSSTSKSFSEEQLLNESINLKARTSGSNLESLTNSHPFGIGLGISVNKNDLAYGARIGATQEINVRKKISEGVTQLLQGNKVLEEKPYCVEFPETRESEFIPEASIFMEYAPLNDKSWKTKVNVGTRGVNIGVSKTFGGKRILKARRRQ